MRETYEKQEVAPQWQAGGIQEQEAKQTTTACGIQVRPRLMAKADSHSNLNKNPTSQALPCNPERVFIETQHINTKGVPMTAVNSRLQHSLPRRPSHSLRCDASGDRRQHKVRGPALQRAQRPHSPPTKSSLLKLDVPSVRSRSILTREGLTEAGGAPNPVAHGHTLREEERTVCQFPGQAEKHVA